MNIQQLIEMHRALQDQMEVPRGLPGMQEAALGLVKESAEVLDEVSPGYRPWVKVDLEAADREAIDVLCYLLVYFVAREWTEEDVVERYRKTNAKIWSRIAEAA